MTKRIAVVTGGMGGLGEAISTKLHDAGYAVVVTHSPNNTEQPNGWRAWKLKGLWCK
ncbi:NAD(P)-dependent dehydrogenase (short-subunit alcohol dehydrogenase family) [Paraburkholderia sp. MM5477-R1]